VKRAANLPLRARSFASKAGVENGPGGVVPVVLWVLAGRGVRLACLPLLSSVNALNAQSVLSCIILQAEQYVIPLDGSQCHSAVT
jgi:hypothetical protein